MNWMDVLIIGCVVTGAVLGLSRGVVRQIAVVAGFYVSLIIAARFSGPAAGLLVAHVSSADRSIAAAYALAGITLVGTLSLSWLSNQVFVTGALPRARAFDVMAGAGLGAAWSWAVVAFAVTVALHGLSLYWGVQEPLRERADGVMAGSKLVGLARTSTPLLREAIRPWLPSGVPLPFAD